MQMTQTSSAGNQHGALESDRYSCQGPSYSTASPAYAKEVEWGGLYFGMNSLVFFFSLVLPSIAEKLGRKTTRSFCLLCGAAGLLSVGTIHSQWLLLFSMIGLGIAWASTLSMPYAMLAGSLPPGETSVYGNL